MPTFALHPLTAAAFAPFGDVFDPLAVTTRLDHVAALQNGRADARPNLFLARTTLATLPLAFERMECHPESSQTFVPYGAAQMPIGVALPDETGQPDLSTFRAFIAVAQGFSYRAGVWHLPVASLGAQHGVLGFMYEDGSPQDCVWADVEPSVLEG